MDAIVEKSMYGKKYLGPLRAAYLFDADGKSRAYFGMGVPVTWFIAPDGSVTYKHIGVLKNEIELITLTSKYLGVKL